MANGIAASNQTAVIRHAASTGSTYEIAPATVDDADGIFGVFEKAFANSLLRQATYPKEKEHLTPRDEFHTWRMHALKKRVASEDAIYLKAYPLNEPTTIVGYACWYRPGHFRDRKLLNVAQHDDGPKSTSPSIDQTQEQTAEPEVASIEQKAEYPAYMEYEVHEEFLEQLDRRRSEIWKGTFDFWCMQ